MFKFSSPVGTTPVSRLSLLFLACLGIKAIDIFLIGIPEKNVPITITNTAGLLFLIFYLAAGNKDLKSIGIHTGRCPCCFVTGMLLIATALFISYTIDFLLIMMNGENPGIMLAASGGNGVSDYSLPIYLKPVLAILLPSIMDSFLDEGLFRGAILHDITNVTFLKLNLVQACLYSVWHSVLPIGTIFITDTFPSVALGEILIGFTFFVMFGYALGLLAFFTGSLVAPWTANIIFMSVFSVLHIESSGEADQQIPLRLLVLAVVFLFLSYSWYNERKTREVVSNDIL
ncbi:type II CAAX prenyl endopeptidase Rce1 family protein [Mesobacillus zeae]|uniref:CPBP family intramembrane metalloprotease n=1 Tax=Mesobacillus zeae TaxID=1917180 RepID=A0A398B8J4_9BACI|nr:CPBP family glutamic-type intramembrane protease [Mesobacillus zeae]RID85814.1 CPBP family intramembrane metalloprotease [Mesobacillus zeae]